MIQACTYLYPSLLSCAVRWRVVLRFSPTTCWRFVFFIRYSVFKCARLGLDAKASNAVLFTHSGYAPNHTACCFKLETLKCYRFFFVMLILSSGLLDLVFRNKKIPFPSTAVYHKNYTVNISPQSNLSTYKVNLL